MLPYFFFNLTTISIWVFHRYIYILAIKMSIEVVIMHAFIVKIKICQKDMSTPYYLIRTPTQLTFHAVQV